MNSKNNTRRSFIQKSLLAAGGIILAPNFISCSSDDDNNNNPAPANPDGFIQKNFNQGVASFDPSSSSVII